MMRLNVLEAGFNLAQNISLVACGQNFRHATLVIVIVDSRIVIVNVGTRIVIAYTRTLTRTRTLDVFNTKGTDVSVKFVMICNCDYFLRTATGSSGIEPRTPTSLVSPLPLPRYTHTWENNI